MLPTARKGGGGADAGGALPFAIARIIRRHVEPDDFDGFAGAVREHTAGGRKLTRAALGALASVWFDPGAVAKIKADLKSAGIL